MAAKSVKIKLYKDNDRYSRDVQVIVNGKDDGIFPLNSALEQAEIARNLYALAGAQSAFRHVIGQEGHRFYAREGWAAFDEVTGWNG